MPRKLTKDAEAHRERARVLLLQELSRHDPSSPSYEKLLEQLNQITQSETKPDHIVQQERFEKRIKAIRYLPRMPWWFQVIFVSLVLFGLVLFVDAIGFWFGFDLLNNNPPASVQETQSSVPLVIKSPRIPQ